MLKNENKRETRIMKNIEKYIDIVLDSLSYCTLNEKLENVGAGLKEECNNRICSECEKQLREWLLEEAKESVLDDAK